ncbi:MAG: hypothetical protein JJ896_03495 [Rhodothermales bacterium]|nr:hypothetical protein [Rhodothermales bacterium]MBO6778698.1 hypothetical protein [Rhodothermales bacterium]
MNTEQLLAAAREAPQQNRLDDLAEVVETLRTKGYSWRQVAEFLQERGIQTDHTRLFRKFGPKPASRGGVVKPITVRKARYRGERLTKRGKTWQIIDLHLPSPLVSEIPLTGYAWAEDGASFDVGQDGSVSMRKTELVTKSGGAYPMAYVRGEFKTDQGDWRERELYIVPNWDLLL